ncbi:MAG: FimV/HubP family polar landmark protein [Porticoccaceae bacterium]
MRQRTAILDYWLKAICNSKPIASVIILSVSCFVVAADSNVELLENSVEPVIQSTQQSDSQSSIPTHTVVVGDTLWSVTFKLRPEGMPMAQAMDVLYENNPQAFLEGDSTKLIEGSVVSFVSSEAISKPADVEVSQENSNLIIPTIDVAKDISVEPEISSEVAPEVIPETPVVATETLVDTVENIESSTEVIAPESELAVNQPADQPDSQALPSNAFSFDQLIAQLKQFDKKDFFQLVAKLKQLPIDFWIFIGALLFAMVINRARKLDQADKAADQSPQGQKPIETVLDGPFAESAGDDVFSDTPEAVTQTNKEAKQIQPKEEITLPGVEALEAQFREDAEGSKSQTNQFLEVDFDDDDMDIDPLQIKLDMASLCIEMGDIESAQAILEEIIGEADKQGKAKAREILDSIET